MAQIVFENEDFLIVNKPQGVATTPGIIPDICTDLFTKRPELLSITGYNKKEGGLLNRLDNETGGLILFAKNDESFEKYSHIMKSSSVTKEYIAIVNGVPEVAYGIITTPISHHSKNKSKMTISERFYRGNPQEASTEWTLLKSNNDTSILKVLITKGVRHQIRVHLSSINLPIIGDKLYNQNTSSEDNHLLFCYAMTIPNENNQKIRIEIKPEFVEKYFPDLLWK